MPHYLRTFIASLLCISSFQTLFSQEVDYSQYEPVDSLTIGDTAYVFKGDTLFSNKGFSIYRGQHLVTGKGSQQGGDYQTIGFKSMVAFPLMFLRGTELKNNAEYRNDPSIRDRDKLREYLDSGKSMIVTKIRSRGRKKKWHYYEVFLADGSSALSLHFRCDIISALRTKELCFARATARYSAPGDSSQDSPY